MAGAVRRAGAVVAALAAASGGMLAAGSLAAAQPAAKGTPTVVSAAASTSTWQRLPTPDPNKDTELDSVSCTSPTACTAVGWTSTGGRLTTPVSLAVDLLVLPVSVTSVGSGGGTAPSTTVAAPPSAARSVLSRLVGGSGWLRSAAKGFHSSAVAERWNGRSWSAQSLPAASTNELLTSVSCSTNARCLAVGLGLNASGSLAVPIAYQWTRSHWQRLTLPVGPLVLLGVDCPAWNRCLAVGAGTGPSASALRWDGSRWRTVVLAKAPAGTEPLLDSVSCSSAWRCAAAGAVASSQTVRPFAEQLTGRGWTAQRFLSATGFATGVSCATSSCRLAGLAGTSNVNVLHPFLAEANGGSWNRQYGPSADAVLNGVACPTADSCLAVGASQVGQNGSDTFAEALSGSTWSTEPTVPAADPSRSLLGVSCPTSTWCVAAGEAGGESLVERS
ncbi:MAG TPA: hypothetical protein VKV06_11520 [Acidimicrobiales bacterium]|nr:hypothetical protein [Acidimicrobiales bacterium]